jgi:putative FmdB family regulatory protein
LPTYDYRCTECGEEFSAEQSIRARPLRKCRKCGGRLEKLLPRTVNLIFKGSGFYVTDYKKGRAEGPSPETGKEALSGKAGQDGKGADKSGKSPEGSAAGSKA